ncbi:tetratricopeptide (TPR) repeat protein [Chryseobacterium sp. SLBN-27]|uniref:tetratricopeptide repeat protein n=1 Tax=Chryseobacterium sp. SLBN-27 TaxID=3042287 RepID=UPI00285B3887|nr:tetratricopeptide repeat protein [Chryseobacterium sp. SLBN-27]MDR6159342.1 tetratricopeptide (TPR) repeat protein [Chryseobacterium sp. SLBN-27]
MGINGDLIEKVRKFNNDEQYDEVINLLSNAILNKYTNAILYSEKAQALWNKQKMDECFVCAQKARELDPNNAKAYHYLGNCISNDNEDKAIELYKQAIELDPYFLNAYHALGNSYHEKKDYDTAKFYYNKCIEIEANFAPAYLALGDLYYDLGKNSKSRLNFDKCIALNPSNTFLKHAYLGIGRIYSIESNNDKAKEYIDKAILIDKTFPHPYNDLGNIYKSDGDFNKAKECYDKYITIDQLWDGIYFNRAEVNLTLENYKEALNDYEKYISLTKKNRDYYYKRALSKIQEINKILSSKTYEEINEIVVKIKDLLKYKNGCVTHFTSLSTTKAIIIENSPFRLSEGTFLNDTSEGMTFFQYLSFQCNLLKDNNTIDELFTQKPFIGSFVSESQHNDLAMWRMYGKEQQEEAKGCALTINIEKYKNSIYDSLDINRSYLIEQDFTFYRVCYLDDEKFVIPDIKNKVRKEKELNGLMKALRLIIEKFNEKGDSSDKSKIEELLNEISFLVKSSEYSYEKEIRLVVNGAGFTKNIDVKDRPKVYIDLAPLKESIAKITVGPKVERSDEWASIFYYSMKNDDFNPEIHISHLPYK